MACRHMKRPTRVRVSPSGQSRARLPLGRVPIRSDKIQRQPNNDEPRPADAGYSSCAQPVTGPAFPRKGCDALPAPLGLGRPRSERCRRSSPETTGRSVLKVDALLERANPSAPLEERCAAMGVTPEMRDAAALAAEALEEEDYEDLA